MESKCPVCQKGTVGFSYDGLKVECSKCWFRCHVEHLPRIAAAMELAASTVEFTAKVNPVLMRHRYAHDRVLEVFGGE
jgi:hypothetical protein